MATKKQLSLISRQLSEKAQSWNQVAKQLSGMQGKIQLSKTEKISVKEAFALLGVKKAQNTYTAKDLVNAWAKEMKGQRKEYEICYISVAKPVAISIDDNVYTLYALKKEQYKAIKEHTFCRLVKAEDRIKGSNDVVVDAKKILLGLAQSINIKTTINTIKEDRAKVDALQTAYVNCGTSAAPEWKQVCKNGNTWSFDAPTVEIKEKATQPKKRTNKKAAKAA